MVEFPGLSGRVHLVHLQQHHAAKNSFHELSFYHAAVPYRGRSPYNIAQVLGTELADAPDCLIRDGPKKNIRDGILVTEHCQRADQLQ